MLPGTNNNITKKRTPRTTESWSIHSYLESCQGARVSFGIQTLDPGDGFMAVGLVAVHDVFLPFLKVARESDHVES